MGIVGELLITFGAIVLLFLAWQLWINNAVVADQQHKASQELTQEWSTDKDKTASAPANEDFGPAPAFAGVGEGAKFAVRNIRQDANKEIAKLVKDKAISEDEKKRGEDDIQKLTDTSIKDVDKVVADKEKELLSV